MMDVPFVEAKVDSILVVYQGSVGSETALDKARVLATLGGTVLRVVEVIQNRPGVGTAFFGKPTIGEAGKLTKLTGECQKRLERIAEPMSSLGIGVSCTALSGDVPREILREVEDNNHGLVVLALEPAEGLGAWRHFLRACPCPVWIVRPGSEARTRRILVAVNPLREDDDLTLDRRALEFALEVARVECAELTIFHTWDFGGADLETSRSETTVKVMQRLIERNRAAHEAALYRLLDGMKLDGIAYDVRMPKGDPCRLIDDFAKEEDVDLVVVGHEGRDGLSGFLYGNTAETVIRRLRCPVAAVKRG